MTQKEIEEFLANTKVYVNGKSKEIQEKLFSLGYCWNGLKGGTKYIAHTEEPFIIIWSDKTMTYAHAMDSFTNCDKREITAEQILSIKLTEPLYRPFKDKEECWQEMLKHIPFGWLKSKSIGSFAHIGSIYQQGGKSHITWSTNEREYFTFDSVNKNYTFADGTPFGIKEE